MARVAYEVKYVDLSELGEAPAWEQLIDEVRATNRPAVIRAAGEDIAEVRPAKRKRRARTPRGKTMTADDSLWSIIGTGEAEQATDVSENIDRYLADAKLSRQI